MEQLTAYEFGIKAFKDGKIRVPIHDKGFYGIYINDRSIPDGTQRSSSLLAWIQGWDHANLEAVVPEAPTRYYKVWVQVEFICENSDTYRDVGEPISVGQEVETLKEIEDILRSIPGLNALSDDVSLDIAQIKTDAEFIISEIEQEGN